MTESPTAVGSADGPANSVRSTRARDRSALAARRAAEARAALASCRFCAHLCGCNRLAGERGPCGAGSRARVFSAQTEVSDELEIVPTFAIALSGCDMRCAFCITGRESWNPGAGELLDPMEIGGRARQALANGARSIMLLGGEPTVFLPDALQIAATLPDDALLVWKTNGRGSAEARAWLDGVFDVWVIDYKFGNDACAERLAGIKTYERIVRENLLWASRNAGLIVRHLLMPGHVDCCWRPVARWIAENLPGTKVSLRSGFWPAWLAGRHPELRGTCSPSESDIALEIARHYSLFLIE